MEPKILEKNVFINENEIKMEERTKGEKPEKIPNSKSKSEDTM
jgi:hypothetical protein